MSNIHIIHTTNKTGSVYRTKINYEHMNTELLYFANFTDEKEPTIKFVNYSNNLYNYNYDEIIEVTEQNTPANIIEILNRFNNFNNVNCVNVFNCSNCTDCSMCIGCYSCTECHDCLYCTRCVECRSCDYCEYINESSYRSYENGEDSDLNEQTATECYFD